MDVFYVAVFVAACWLLFRFWKKHVRPRWNYLTLAMRVPLHPEVVNRSTDPTREVPTMVQPSNPPPKPKTRRRKVKSKDDPYTRGFTSKSFTSWPPPKPNRHN